MGLCAERPLRDKPVSDRPPYRRPNLLWQLEQKGLLSWTSTLTKGPIAAT